MTTPPFELHFYEDAQGRKPALQWIRNLSSVKKKAAGFAMEQILQQQGVGVCDDSSWGTPLGDGVFEFRVMRAVNWTVEKKGKKVKKSVKVSLRIFCHAHGQKKVLVLSGYDKGRSAGKARQQSEIERAKGYLRDWKGRQRAKGGKRQAKAAVRKRPARRKKRRA